jgi:hypothetical protein
MLPDWLFSTRVEMVLRDRIASLEEHNSWLRARVTQLQDKLAEAKNPGVTARVEAPKRRQQKPEREMTIAEKVSQPGPSPDLPMYEYD